MFQAHGVKKKKTETEKENFCVFCFVLSKIAAFAAHKTFIVFDMRIDYMQKLHYGFDFS